MSWQHLLVNMASVKRKRVSKKNKKSWRKNVNIDDVDDFLEEKRFEERMGFKVSELKDEELFEIHTVGDFEDSHVVSNQNNNEVVEKPVTHSFRVRENTTPKCFAILERRSKVSDPLIKRNRIKTKEERMHPSVKKKIAERLANGILTEKEKRSMKDRKAAEILRKKKTSIPQFKYELWSKENNDSLNNLKDWLYCDTVRHTLTNTGQLRKPVPNSILKKTSHLPGVEEPHPGLSYNPSLKDHTDIINKVVEEEMVVVKEEQRLKRATTDLYSKVNQSHADREWLREMSAGLTVDAKSEDDDESITGDYKAVNPPVKNKKKTLQKRRRLREDSKMKAEHRQKKLEKKKISDIYKLRQLNAGIKKREVELKVLKKKRLEKKKEKALKTKQLSHTKYEEPETDFTAIDDLSGNLRGIKTTSNLLMDRFKSLQKRNILEPTLKQFPKKGKKKRYERQHTKMGWEPKGY